MLMLQWKPLVYDAVRVRLQNLSYSVRLKYLIHT